LEEVNDGCCGEEGEECGSSDFRSLRRVASSKYFEVVECGEAKEPLRRLRLAGGGEVF